MRLTRVFPRLASIPEIQSFQYGACSEVVSVETYDERSPD